MSSPVCLDNVYAAHHHVEVYLNVNVLLGISLLFFLASLITEIFFNLIVLPAKEEREKAEPDRLLDANDGGLDRLYKNNRPSILRRVSLLNFLIESGGSLFFVIFGVTVLIYVYAVSDSITWILICVPGLIFLYFITNLVSILLSTLLMREIHRNDDVGDGNSSA